MTSYLAYCATQCPTPLAHSGWCNGSQQLWQYVLIQRECERPVPGSGARRPLPVAAMAPGGMFVWRFRVWLQSEQWEDLKYG